MVSNTWKANALTPQRAEARCTAAGWASGCRSTSGEAPTADCSASLTYGFMLLWLSRDGASNYKPAVFR